jgi:acyl carrier protein
MFLASLELRIHLSLMQPQHLSRVAELVQRTNQFNLTSIRRRSNEIEAISKAGDLNLLVVHVQDRFGDYGLVGTLFFRRHDSLIEVDTFILSCRVLGRGVEYQIVRELGHIARSEGATGIMLRYRETPRNRPAREFLEGTFAQFRRHATDVQNLMTEVVFLIPAEFLIQLRDPIAASPPRHTPPLKVAIDDMEQPAPSIDWHDEPPSLCDVRDILQQINASSTSKPPSAVAGTSRPMTKTEQTLTAIYAEVLGLDNVGVHDSFFHLGGTSLQAVEAVVRIEAELGFQILVLDLFEAPSIEALATRLESMS